MGKSFLLTLALLACAPAAAEAPPQTPATPDTTILAHPTPLPDPTELVVSEHTLNNFAWLYAFWRETEFAGCLYGLQKADTLYIDHMRLAGIINASPRTIDYACVETPSLIGFLHSHTEHTKDVVLRCTFSETDDNDRERRWALRDNLKVEVLVCAPDGFAFRLRGGTDLVLRAMPPVMRGTR